MGVEDSLGGETRERLIYRIYMLMETEIELLQDILKQFNDANQVSLFVCHLTVIWHLDF